MPTRFLSYAGSVPGPTIVAAAGQETIVRYNNNIGGIFKGTVHPCDAPGRSGRPFSVHLHGSASLAPYDGWAEDETCFGEVKEYVYPNNRPVTGWYHDHALHITAANAYFGLASLYIVSAKVKDGACGEPWNMEDIEELHMILQDKALDSSCQLAFYEDGPHLNNFYGDINVVSGIPFPKMMLQPKYYRMRILNAAVSRPYLLKIKDASLKDIGPDVCLIIASDGGFRQEPIAFPSSGLLLGVAERYEVVCNLEKYAGQTLYIWNDYNDKIMKDVPYFCYSHLISKIEVAATGSGAVFNAADLTIKPDQPLQRVLSDSDMAQAVAMAQAGQSHRTMKFERTGGQWAINGETWSSFKIEATDVGHNTWEVWKFETGGGWHPVHIHLIDLFIIRRDSSSRSVESFELNSPKDVLFLGPSKEIWIVARFGAHRGDYMFHCHNLRHEDNDMMRAYSITNGSSKVNPVEPNLTLNNIVYSNWAYADPMLGETAARKRGGYKRLSLRYSKNILAKNVYRIFYPKPSDVEFLKGPSNPWKAIWKNHCSL